MNANVLQTALKIVFFEESCSRRSKSLPPLGEKSIFTKFSLPNIQQMNLYLSNLLYLLSLEFDQEWPCSLA